MKYIFGAICVFDLQVIFIRPQIHKYPKLEIKFKEFSRNQLNFSDWRRHLYNIDRNQTEIKKKPFPFRSFWSPIFEQSRNCFESDDSMTTWWNYIQPKIVSANKFHSLIDNKPIEQLENTKQRMENEYNNKKKKRKNRKKVDKEKN